MMMSELLNPLLWLEQFQSFLQQGGVILILICACTFFLWMVVIERLFFFAVQQKKLSQQVLQQWKRRRDRHSWYALQIRRRWFSLVKVQVMRNIPSINAIVAIAPLLGLLGTVVGMVTVFDVMAVTGASNARAMAEGVSKATIPTMAGMVVSLVGLFFSTTLQRHATNVVESLAQELTAES